MLRWRRYRLPRLDCAAIRRCSRIRADREACTANCISFGSAQNAASLIPAAELVQSAGAADRAADRDLRTRLDVSEAGNVRGQCPLLVGAADSRRSCRALALSSRSYGPHS